MEIYRITFCLLPEWDVVRCVLVKCFVMQGKVLQIRLRLFLVISLYISPTIGLLHHSFSVEDEVVPESWEA